MKPIDPNLVLVMLGTMIPALGMWLTSRSARRSADHSRIEKLESRVDRLEKRDYLLVAYVNELREHIYRGDAPPPPDWPDLP